MRSHRGILGNCALYGENTGQPTHKKKGQQAGPRQQWNKRIENQANLKKKKNQFDLVITVISLAFSAQGNLIIDLIITTDDLLMCGEERKPHLCIPGVGGVAGFMSWEIPLSSTDAYQ